MGSSFARVSLVSSVGLHTSSPRSDSKMRTLPPNMIHLVIRAFQVSPVLAALIMMFAVATCTVATWIRANDVPQDPGIARWNMKAFK